MLEFQSDSTHDQTNGFEKKLQSESGLHGRSSIVCLAVHLKSFLVLAMVKIQHWFEGKLIYLAFKIKLNFIKTIKKRKWIKRGLL